MTEEVIDINNKTPSIRLLSLGNPNVIVPKQAIKQTNNDKRNDYHLLLSNFSKLTGKFNAILPPKHSVRHHICTHQRRSSRPPNPPIGGAQANFGGPS